MHTKILLSIKNSENKRKKYQRLMHIHSIYFNAINCQSKFVMTETNDSIPIVAVHKMYTKILFSKNSENKHKLLSSPS